MLSPATRRRLRARPGPRLSVVPTSTGKHVGVYDESYDRTRKNGTTVPARHSSDPASVTAVIVR